MTRTSRFLNRCLDWLDQVTDRTPLWVTCLTLLALSTGAWYLVVQVCVTIADAMMSYPLRN